MKEYNTHITCESPVGVNLDNGATFLQMVADVDGDFVLAWQGWQSPTPWVVWRLCRNGATEHGHYFDRLDDAARCLYERAAGRLQTKWV